MSSYIIVMMLPVIITAMAISILVNATKSIRNERETVNSYLYHKYSKILSSSDVFSIGFDLESLIDQADRKLIDLNIYDIDGSLYYSSNLHDYKNIVKEDLEDAILKNLYDFNSEKATNTIKGHILDDNKILGVYEIRIHRTDAYDTIRNVLIFWLILLSLGMAFLLYFSNKFTENRINKPIQKLVFAMNEFGNGRFVKINSRRDDEIGEVIYNFILMRDRLNENSELLKKQQQEKNYMVMAISHDLKTPLTAIRTNIELLKATRELDISKLEGAIEKCDHMKEMLDDLMNYNTLDSQNSLEIVRVDADEAMDTILFGYEDLIESSDLEANFEVNTKGEYDMDVGQMDRVLGNLISNAIKYSKKDGTIRVSVRSSEFGLPEFIDKSIAMNYKDGNDKLYIVVQNSAEKIPDDKLNKIAYPFYKIDKSRQGEKGSMGLGLSIVVLIVEKHGGRLDFYSSDDYLTIVIEMNRNILKN